MYRSKSGTSHYSHVGVVDGKVKIKLSLRLTKNHAFFDLGTRWRCVVGFTPRPLYPPRVLIG